MRTDQARPPYRLDRAQGLKERVQNRVGLVGLTRRFAKRASCELRATGSDLFAVFTRVRQARRVLDRGAKRRACIYQAPAIVPFETDLMRLVSFIADLALMYFFRTFCILRQIVV